MVMVSSKLAAIGTTDLTVGQLGQLPLSNLTQELIVNKTKKIKINLIVKIYVLRN
jgi:hypothetical protein